MSTLHDNTAYDFSRFEPRSSAVRQPAVQEPELKPVKKQNPKAEAAAAAKKKQGAFTPLHAFKWISILGCFMAALLIMMSNNVKLNELDQSIQTQQNQLGAAQSEETTLSMNLESRMSLQKIEDYAVNKLGMHKIDQNQVQPVDLNDQDKVEVAGKQSGNILDQIGSLFDRIMEYLR